MTVSKSTAIRPPQSRMHELETSDSHPTPSHPSFAGRIPEQVHPASAVPSADHTSGLSQTMSTFSGRTPAGFSGSYSESVERFDQQAVAASYPAEFKGTWRERREASCLRKLFATLPRGSRVLDLPCGTGRLTPLLAERGLQIVGADSSPHMVQLARNNWEQRRGRYAETGAEARFEVREGGRSGFADGEFDAVICNRLFHHFRESSVRIAVLSELRRVCWGPILVSFFNSFSLDAIRFRLKHRLRGTTPTDRIPIPYSEFAADVAAAGLQIESTLPILWGISPMWYLRLRSADAAQAMSREAA